MVQRSILAYVSDPATLAAKRIQCAAKRAGRLLVAWSGGKDSTAALLAAHRCCSEKLYAAYIHIVGQTHAMNLRAVLETARILGLNTAHMDVCGTRIIRYSRLPRPPALLVVRSHGRLCKGFWNEAVARGWPAPLEHRGVRAKRWCCQVFKAEAFDALAKMGFTVHVAGSKMHDSSYRRRLLASLDPQCPLARYRTHSTLFPLYDMADADSWSIIESLAPEIKQVIEQQYTALGYSPNCMLCPLMKDSELRRLAEMMPCTWITGTLARMHEISDTWCAGSSSKRKMSCTDLWKKMEILSLAAKSKHCT